MKGQHKFGGKKVRVAVDMDLVVNDDFEDSDPEFEQVDSSNNK